MSDKAYMPQSKTVEWSTPQWLFDGLNKEFEFTLDVAATEENTKCPFFMDKETDALSEGRDWKFPGDAVWCNPPYGREIALWVKKAHEQVQKFNITVVMLIPARTDTRWFHEYIYKRQEVRFIKGRLKFGDSKASAPFPNMIVIFTTH